MDVVRARLANVPDCVIGVDPTAIERVLTEAQQLGLHAEGVNRQDYDGPFVIRMLRCSPLGRDAVRAALRPSFHNESVITVQRTREGYRVELRRSREHLWLTQFGDWLAEGLERTPGADVYEGLIVGDPVERADTALARAGEWIERPRGLGADGITVSFESTYAGIPPEFTAWSPRHPGERAFELLRVLSGLADRLRDPLAISCVQDLRTYSEP